jgi:putative membrane protein
MSEQNQSPKRGDPSEHMANERTLLSWIRTGVTIVSIGLIVQRFGVEVGPAKGSGIFGVALVGLGCLTLIIGMIQFFRTRRQINTGEFASSLVGYVIVVTVTLVLSGAFMVYVLLATGLP